MKTVLIIAADFVPSSLPPATRTRFFSKHLAEFGWNPIVLTTEPEYYEWPVDSENEGLLPESVEVIRTPALSAKWTRKIGVGDIGMRTLWHHWQVIKKLCGERRIDLIFIPVPPYVSMVLGRLAHRRFGTPYIIDYIDPWVTEYYRRLPKEQRPPKWAFADVLARIVEPFALGHVSHITGVSKGTTKSVISRYSWLSESDPTELPYGAEADDFDYLSWKPRQNRIFDPKDGFLHVSYVGACIPAMYGTVRALFRAMRLGLDRSTETFHRLRLHFVGTTYSANGISANSLLPLAREMGVSELVDEHPGRIPYLESLQLMLDSHALFLVGSDEAHYTASKVFPYILARRPVLAIFHEESSVVQILRETGAGHAITFNSARPALDKTDEISVCMERILSLPRDHRPQTRWEAFEPYTTRAMAARLASAFDFVATPRHQDASNAEVSQSEIGNPKFN